MLQKNNHNICSSNNVRRIKKKTLKILQTQNFRIQYIFCLFIFLIEKKRFT